MTVVADTNNPAQYTLGSPPSAQVTVNDNDDAPQDPDPVDPPPVNPVNPVNPTPTNPVTPTDPVSPTPPTSPTTPGETPDPQQPQQPEPEPVIPTLSIQADTDSVTEGAPASFTITAEPAPVESITLSLTIAAQGDFTTQGVTATKTLTIDRATTPFRIPTISDFIDEQNGSITLTLQPANGYILSPNPSATVEIHDDDTAGITLSTPGLRIPEIGQSAQYTIQLTSQPLFPVTVTLLPSESAIVTGSPSRVTFTPDHWNMPQSFTLTAQQEGAITLVHAITSQDPDYSGIPSTDGHLRVLVGEDWTAIASAWQSRFIRTSAAHVLEGIAERMQATPETGIQGQLAGVSLSSHTGVNQTSYTQNIHPPVTAHSRSVTLRELLSASSMSFSTPATYGSIASFWAQGAFSEFDGKSGETSLDAEVLTTMLGVDQTHTHGQRGLILSHSRGEGKYTSRDSGEIESEQTLFTPWWSQDFNDHITVWGALGYGTGDLTLIRRGREDLTTDTNTAFVAVGSETILKEEAHRSLSLVSDVLWLRTRTDSVADGLELNDTSAHGSRMRAGLEGNWRIFAIPTIPRFTAGQTLKISGESALRHDGGDAESGFGVEVGGGVQWTDSKRGLNLQVRGRTLITHHDEDLKDRGLSISMGFEPSLHNRQMEFTLQQDWGTVSSGKERLMNAEVIQLTDTLGSGRFRAQAAWRFAFHNGRYTARPWLGVGLYAEERETTLGWQLQSTTRSSERTLGVKTIRQEQNDQSRHLIKVEAGVRW